MTANKKGRPATNPKTLAKRRVDAVISNRPLHTQKSSEDQIKSTQDWLEHLEKIRKEILQKYKHGPWTPDEHAYNMASLGDELLVYCEKEIGDNEDKYARRAKNIRDEAGKENKRRANIRAASVFEKNKALISKVDPKGYYTPHKVAEILRSQWYLVTEAQRFADEPRALTRRGDEEKAPSIRTIERWLKSAE